MSSRTPRAAQSIALAPLDALLRGQRRRRPLISPRLLGFAPPHRPSRAKLAAMSEAELRDLEIHRAFLCGARYSCWGWRRREPPRFRHGRRCTPEFDLLMECGRAFYRGYDAATRARNARNRTWIT